MRLFICCKKSKTWYISYVISDKTSYHIGINDILIRIIFKNFHTLNIMIIKSNILNSSKILSKKAKWKHTSSGETFRTKNSGKYIFHTISFNICIFLLILLRIWRIVENCIINSIFNICSYWYSQITYLEVLFCWIIRIKCIFLNKSIILWQTSVTWVWEIFSIHYSQINSTFSRGIIWTKEVIRIWSICLINK